MLGCESWKMKSIDPPMRWDDHPVHKQKPINTSFPVLFISNTFDPVTPLYAGVQMAKKFVGAGLVEQKSMGHCSLTAVSRCTIKKIRQYFTEGRVPPPPKDGRDLEHGEWDRCEADEWPFRPHTADNFIAMNGVEAMEDLKILELWKEMQNLFATLKHYGQTDLMGSFDWLAEAAGGSNL